MTPGSVEVDVLKIFEMAFETTRPLIFAAAALGLGFSLVFRLYGIFFRALYGSSSYSPSTDPGNYQLRKFDTLAADITKLVPKTDPVVARLPEWRKSIEELSNLGTPKAEDFVVGLLSDLDKMREQLQLAQTLKEISKTKDTAADIKEQVARLNDKLEALIEVKMSDEELLC